MAEKDVREKDARKVPLDFLENRRDGGPGHREDGAGQTDRHGETDSRLQVMQRLEAQFGNGTVSEALAGADLDGIGTIIAAEWAMGMSDLGSLGLDSPSTLQALSDFASSPEWAEANSTVISRHQQDSGPLHGHQALEFIRRSRGHALPKEVASKLSRVLGIDLSQTRIHTDSAAAKAAEAVNAHAFATGEDVYFAQGEYQPGTRAGDELLLHELTHVKQHQEGRVPTAPQGEGLQVSSPTDSHEREAVSTAAEAVDTLHTGDFDLAPTADSGTQDEMSAATETVSAAGGGLLSRDEGADTSKDAETDGEAKEETEEKTPESTEEAIAQFKSGDYKPYKLPIAFTKSVELPNNMTVGLKFKGMMQAIPDMKIEIESAAFSFKPTDQSSTDGPKLPGFSFGFSAETIDLGLDFGFCGASWKAAKDANAPSHFGLWFDIMEFMLKKKKPQKDGIDFDLSTKFIADFVWDPTKQELDLDKLSTAMKVSLKVSAMSSTYNYDEGRWEGEEDETESGMGVEATFGTEHDLNGFEEDGEFSTDAVSAKFTVYCIINGYKMSFDVKHEHKEVNDINEKRIAEEQLRAVAIKKAFSHAATQIDTIQEEAGNPKAFRTRLMKLVNDNFAAMYVEAVQNLVDSLRTKDVFLDMRAAMFPEDKRTLYLRSGNTIRPRASCIESMEEAFAESEERRKVHEAIYFEGSVELDNLGGVYTSNYGSVTISVERRPGQKPVIRGKYWVQRYPEQEESPSADQTQAEEPTNVPGQFAGEVDYEGGFASVDWSEGEAHGTAELQIQQNGTRISGPWKTEGSDESGHWNMTKAD